MRVRKVDATLDRQIITAMVVSDRFLKQVHTIYRPEFMMAPFAIEVAKWCMDYFKSYSKAPGKHITDIYYQKQREGLNDELSEQIEKFLSSLSEEYEDSAMLNVDYLLDKAEGLFKKRYLKTVIEEAGDQLDKGETSEVETQLKLLRAPALPKSTGINPFNNSEVIQRAFESRQEILFHLPGALGQMINPQLVRNSLIAILAPEKRGKTWTMMDWAMRAAISRCRVAIFQIGDMTDDQYVRRQMIWIARRSDDPRYCGELKVPILDCDNNQRAACKKNRTGLVPVVDHEGEFSDVDRDIDFHVPCTECHKNKHATFRGAVWYQKKAPVEPLTWREAFRASQAWTKRNKTRDFKLMCYANNEINVAGIESQLDVWESTEGFIPDVVFIDYADNLAPEPGGLKDARGIEGERWKALSSLRQSRKICLVTATQATKEGHEREHLKAGNVSEDKRKLAHVTAMYGLNQTDKEKRKGIIRFSSIVVREDAFSVSNQVVVLRSLEMGRPYLHSYFHHFPDKKKTEED